MAVEATRAQGFAVGPTVKRKIAKRYAAERRFRLYGIAAILSA